MNWMDLCIIMIIVLNGFMGLSMGLVLSLFSIGSYVIAFIAAKLYYPYLSSYVLENTKIVESFQEYFFNKITEPRHIASTEMAGNDNIFEILHFPEVLEDMLLRSTSVREYSEEILNGVHGYFS